MSIPSNEHQQHQHPHKQNVNIRNGQHQQQRYDEAPTTDAYNKPSPPPAPNVRHIPIFVEGRDEPLTNRNIETNGQQRATSANDHHQIPNSKSSGGIFDRVKNFPTINRMQAPQQQRSNSPHRTGPSNVQRSTSGAANSPSRQQTDQSHPLQTPRPETERPQPHPDADSIVKIQSIQRDVLNLMDEVEKFTGSTRKDRQYLYLDEMLTQNLLKLDTIDTEGKENIKQARREAIKCINKCISVLEAKADTNPPQPVGEQMTQNHNQQTTGNIHHNNRFNNFGQQNLTK